MEEKITHEKKDLNPKKLIIINISTGLLIVFIVVFCYILFVGYKDYQYKKNVNSFGRDSQAQAVRDYEEKQLTTYGFVDKEKGIVRVPVVTTFEEVVEDYKE